MNATLNAFFSSTSTPTQAQINYLVKRHGVPPLALGCDPDGGGFVLGAADVVFDGRWFDFVAPDAEDARPALVIVGRDVGGNPVDLVAWAPPDNTVAVYFDRVGALGAQEAFAPQINDALPVFPDVLGWLRAGRRGVVIVNSERARWELAGLRLQAADVDHGLKLRKDIALPPPLIVVAPSACQAAA